MRRIITAVSALVMLVLLVVPVSAGVTADVPLFNDMAGLVSAGEARVITEKLMEIGERHQVVLAVVTVDSLQGKSTAAFADDYYDYNNFAYDGKNDGVLLLVSMEERDWYISTTGSCIDHVSGDDIDSIGDSITGDLASGNYAAAFTAFAEKCGDIIYSATHFSPIYIAVGVVIGIVIGFIGVSTMKSGMKTVRFKAAAKDYLREGSLDIRKQTDTFLYRNVRRVKRETDTGRGTHTGSSGTSHGGGGGKF